MATSVESTKATTKAHVVVRFLNKGAAKTSPTPRPKPTSIGSKGHTATRLTVVAAFLIAVGAAALAVVSAARSDPAGVVIAVYIAVTAIAVAPVIVAEIRAQADVQTKAMEHADVKLVRARPGEAVIVGETDDMLLIDASAGDVRVELPEPSTSGNRMLTFERIDRTDHDVVLDPVGRSLRPADAELRLVVADGAWTAVVD